MSVPYHTRSDSKPFSYSARGRSSSLNRGEESSSNGLSSVGLASPQLIRKLLGEASNGSNSGSDHNSSGSNGSNFNGSTSFNGSYSSNLSPTSKEPPKSDEETFREVPITKSHLDFAEMSQESSSASYGFDMKRSSFDDFISKKKSSPSEMKASPEDLYSYSSKSPFRTMAATREEELYSKTLPKKTSSPDVPRNPFEDFDRPRTEARHVPIQLEREESNGRETVSNAQATDLTDILLNRSNDESWLEKQLQKLKERKTIPLSSTSLSSGVGGSYLNSSTLSSGSFLNSSTYSPVKSTFDEIESRTRSSTEGGSSVPIIREDKPYSELYSSSTLERQKRMGQRQRFDSESSEGGALDTSSLHQKLMAASLENGSRPITPAFPPGTPYNNRSRANTRAPSPCGIYSSTQQRRGSIGSVHSSDISSEESANNMKLVKDNFKYWYKPSITREEAIGLLKHRPPGTFIVRDSHSFPGAYGLALKVNKAPPPSTSKPRAADPLDELVRHFLIEPTTKGVRLKGYSNEPIFASLSSLIYQHSLTSLALPTKLVLPNSDLTLQPQGVSLTKSDSMRRLFDSGAACNVSYLFTMETDALTGSVAVDKSVSTFLELTKDIDNNPGLVVVNVHFKVNTQGITITDNDRKLFFRKHYNISTIGYCGLDPHSRTYVKNSPNSKIFAFVAKKHGSRTHNQCHVFAALEPEQPAVAIVNFVNRVLSLTNPKRIEVV